MDRAELREKVAVLISGAPFPSGRSTAKAGAIIATVGRACADAAAKGYSAQPPCDCVLKTPAGYWIIQCRCQNGSDLEAASDWCAAKNCGVAILAMTQETPDD